MAGARFSIRSKSGRSKRGSLLRMKSGKTSLSWRWDSLAIVSKTSDDLPDPDTPVTTVSAGDGMLTVTPVRLFVRASWTTSGGRLLFTTPPARDRGSAGLRG